MIDGVEYQRRVYAMYRPNPADSGEALEVTPTVTVGGTPTTAFSTDYDRGLITFDSPMSGDEVIRWSAPCFSLWVRFDNDRLPFSIDNKSGSEFVVNGTVELLEIPPPAPESGS